MNRKHKFPCSQKHYTPKGLGPDGKSMWWSQQELDTMYDGRCSDCRENYKHTPNYHLFYSKWWNGRILFRPWGIFNRNWFKAAVKSYGFWGWLRKSFYESYQMDGVEVISFPFFELVWNHLEFSDIREEWIDLSKYYPSPIFPTSIKNYNEHTQYLIKVAHRYRRMWEVELKFKSLFCDFSGRDSEKCEYGTSGCKNPHSLDFISSMKSNKIMFKEWMRGKL